VAATARSGCSMRLSTQADVFEQGRLCGRGEAPPPPAGPFSNGRYWARTRTRRWKRFLIRTSARRAVREPFLRTVGGTTHDDPKRPRAERGVWAGQLESQAPPIWSVPPHDRTSKETDGTRGLKGSSGADARRPGCGREPAERQSRSGCGVHPGRRRRTPILSTAKDAHDNSSSTAYWSWSYASISTIFPSSTV
jgi:hypothetical protein